MVLAIPAAPLVCPSETRSTQQIAGVMRALGALVLAVTALTLTAAGASAAVVCNEEGDCWRVRGAPRYEPSLRLRILPDSWRWREGEHYRWREPGHGHGYWRGGSWIDIR